jgi:gluconate kinase
VHKPYNSSNTISTVYLLCGVPGSGKTWVANQLTDKFMYIEHDQYIKQPELELATVINACNTQPKPVLLTCPFGETALRDALTSQGIPTVPLFIVEPPETIKRRYEARDKIHIPQSHLTRASTILNRAVEWNSVHGDSIAILNHLRNLHV